MVLFCLPAVHVVLHSAVKPHRKMATDVMRAMSYVMFIDHKDCYCNRKRYCLSLISLKLNAPVCLVFLFTLLVVPFQSLHLRVMVLFELISFTIKFSLQFLWWTASLGNDFDSFINPVSPMIPLTRLIGLSDWAWTTWSATTPLENGLMLVWFHMARPPWSQLQNEI